MFTSRDTPLPHMGIPQGALLGLDLTRPGPLSCITAEHPFKMGLLRHGYLLCPPFTCGGHLLVDRALCPLPRLPSFWTLAYLYGHGPYSGSSRTGVLTFITHL
jgi:hypothetical protein